MSGQRSGREQDGSSYVRLNDPTGADGGILRHVVVRRHAGRDEDMAVFRYARDAQAFVDSQSYPERFEVRKQGKLMVGVSGHGYAILAALERGEGEAEAVPEKTLACSNCGGLMRRTADTFVCVSCGARLGEPVPVPGERVWRGPGELERSGYFEPDDA